MGKRKLIVLGAGGHARVLIDCVRSQKMTVEAVLDVDQGNVGNVLDGITIEHEEQLGRKYKKGKHFLLNAIGSTESLKARASLYSSWHNDGWAFLSVIHPSATVAKSAVIGEGAQIMAGAIIQAGAIIGRNVLVNTGAIVEHDCQIGDSTHIGPRAVVCGGTVIEDRVHVGVGAVIIQQRHIGQACTIAAGAVVINNLYSGTRVCGIPARSMTDHRNRNTARSSVT